MSKQKLRLKILTKIAQQVADTATNSLPQDTVATTAVLPPPPSFIASQMWGWLGTSYNPITIVALNNLISLINLALHYSSNGQTNFQTLKNSSFQIDPSGIPSVDCRNLINLAMLIYRTFLNSGNQFAQKVTPIQIKGWADKISVSQPLLNLSQINPSGIIAQKVPGSLRDNILNYIRYLVMYNPIK